MRRTRHRRRFHTDRVVAARRARYRRETPEWSARLRDQPSSWPMQAHWLMARLSYGRLATMDPWDCGRRCLLCHWGKHMEPRRAREKRAWRKEEWS